MPNDHHVLAMHVFGLAEVTPALQPHVVHILVAGQGPGKINVANLMVLVAGGENLGRSGLPDAGEQFGGHVFDGRTLLDGDNILERERLAAALLLAEPANVYAGREFKNEQGLGTRSEWQL